MAYKQGPKMGNDRYTAGISKGDFGHASKVHKCNVFEAQRSDARKVENMPMGRRGYPQQAWDYKY